MYARLDLLYHALLKNPTFKTNENYLARLYVVLLKRSHDLQWQEVSIDIQNFNDTLNQKIVCEAIVQHPNVEESHKLTYCKMLIHITKNIKDIQNIIYDIQKFTISNRLILYKALIKHKKIYDLSHNYKKPIYTDLLRNKELSESYKAKIYADLIMTGIEYSQALSFQDIDYIFEDTKKFQHESNKVTVYCALISMPNTSQAIIDKIFVLEQKILVKSDKDQLNDALKQHSTYRKYVNQTKSTKNSCCIIF